MAVGTDVVEWATAISKNKNDRRIIFRYAKQFRAEFSRRSQPIRIDILWTYTSESGLPIAEDRERMDKFEDTLEVALDQEACATLALVSTGEELRQWTYYARSESEFGARFDFAISGMPEFPIEIHAAHDPEWSTYDKFVAGVKVVVN